MPLLNALGMVSRTLKHCTMKHAQMVLIKGTFDMLSFAITANKAQGQTFHERTGIALPRAVFPMANFTSPYREPKSRLASKFSLNHLVKIMILLSC